MDTPEAHFDAYNQQDARSPWEKAREAQKQEEKQMTPQAMHARIKELETAQFVGPGVSGSASKGWAMNSVTTNDVQSAIQTAISGLSATGVCNGDGSFTITFNF